MYMADFPILKWMQVDGRSVPFTYPQHQKGNGYVITGEDNPLPTGNHVMTESGIWVPQRGSDEGAAHTQLTGSNVEYDRVVDVTISPGSLLTVIPQQRIDSSKVYAYFTADARHRSVFYLVPRNFRAGGGHTDAGPHEILEQDNARTGNILSDVRALYYHVSIRNQDTDSHTYTVVLGGTK